MKYLYTDLMEYNTDENAQTAYVTSESGSEVDYMEYATDGAAQTAYVSSDSGGDPGTWDLLDEDCAAIDDWVDGDTFTAASEVSPAGQFRMDTNAGAADNAAAHRTRDIGSIPNTFTVEIKLYHDSIGALADIDSFLFMCSQGDEYAFVKFSSDGIHISDTDSGWTEVGTNLVKEGGSAEWQTWRFLFTFGTFGEGTVDVYLDDTTHTWEKVGDTVPCSVENAAYDDGYVRLQQSGYATDDMVTHIDYMKIATGLYSPTNNLQSYSESSIKEQGSYSLKAVALITDSLNDTLTKSGLSIDLTDVDTLTFDARASRTGEQFEVSIHDSGGTTTTKTVNITDIDTWQEVIWDISGVSNANKDDIDEIIIKITNADAENTIYIDNFIQPLSLQCYSEDTIKQQGSYSLKGIALAGALNSTLTKTLTDYLDYSIMDKLIFQVRASRTGENLQIQIHDVGGTTSSHTINIASANTWQTETWDISGITGTDRDTIDSIIIKIINADVENTFYFDNLFSQINTEHVSVWVG